MYKAKYQALKILEILIDYRSSVRLRHLLNDFKIVRPAPPRRAVLPRRPVAHLPLTIPSGFRGRAAAHS